MMQWTENASSRQGYNSSVSPETCSTVNTSISTNSVTSSGNVKREAGDIARSNINTTEHLQFCLSMLPQSCSCKLHNSVQRVRTQLNIILCTCSACVSSLALDLCLLLHLRLISDKFSLQGFAAVILESRNRKFGFLRQCSDRRATFNRLPINLQPTTQNCTLQALRRFTTRNLETFFSEVVTRHNVLKRK